MENVTEISLSQLFQLMLRNKLLLLLSAVLGVAVALAVTYAMKNQYESSAKLYVYIPATGQQSTDQDLSAINYAQKVINTYIQMLDTKSFYRKINEDVNLGYTDLKMQKMIQFSILNSTEVFQVTVKTDSPEKSLAIAQSVTNIAPQVIQGIQETARLKIVDPPVIDTVPVSPSKKINLAIGLLAGLVIGVIYIILRDLLDTKIKSADELTDRYGLHILSEVADISEEERKKQSKRKASKYDYTISDKYIEAYRTARTNLNFAIIKKGCKKIAVVSPIGMEGKTTTSVSLAVTLSQQLNVKVLLIDCDLHKPRVYRYFKTQNMPGLTDFLCGMYTYADVAQNTVYDNLKIICAGTIPPNPSELLASDVFTEFIDSVGSYFDYIIFDTPPLNLVSDVLGIISLMDGVVVSLVKGESVHPELNKALETLKNANVKPAGVIIHGVETARGKYFY